jgi:hypothetical protein
VNGRATDIVERERQAGWIDLAGSRVECSVPLRQAVLDTLLSRVSLPQSIERIEVQLMPALRVRVLVTAVVFGFRKRFELRLRLAPALDCRTSPRLHVAIENHALLAAVLAMVGPALRWPHGVSIDHATIVVDLAPLAARHGVSDLLQQLSSVSFESDDGILWINAALAFRQVEAAATAAVPRSLERSPLPLEIPELLDLLDGARAVWTLRVSQDLLNALAAEALYAATSSPTEQTRPPWIGRLIAAVQSTQLELEAGTLIVKGRAVLGKDGAPEPNSKDAGSRLG